MEKNVIADDGYNTYKNMFWCENWTSDNTADMGDKVGPDIYLYLN